jgi:hypothetical protein
VQDPSDFNYEALWANKKIAVGAANTFFAVVTPANAAAAMYGTLLGFRVGNAPGSFGFMMSTGNCHDKTPPTIGCLSVDDWQPSGYHGPAYQGGVPQIVIWRSTNGFNIRSGLQAPVVDMAVIAGTTGTLHVAFFGVINEDGLVQYQEESNEQYDFDWRDPSIDGKHKYLAGFMLLGHWALAFGEYFAYNGVIHHIELHNTTLTNTHVLDVVWRLNRILKPSAPSRNTCFDCINGTHDHDSQPSTDCKACDMGQFPLGAGDCAGRCALGSTTLNVGSTSIFQCVKCPNGKHGDYDQATGGSVCVNCVAGRFSNAIGAPSIGSCAPCPEGTFSGAGWSRCASSGCIDPWADNYDPTAVVESGLCQYSCSNMQARAALEHGHKRTNAGACVILSVTGEWQQFHIDNRLVLWNECTNNGDNSSQAACEKTGNVYVAATTTSNATCTNTTVVHPPLNVSSKSACEDTGQSYTLWRLACGQATTSQTRNQKWLPPDEFHPRGPNNDAWCGILELTISRESWIFQGRPLRGSTNSSVQYPKFAPLTVMGFAPEPNDISARMEVVWRYIKQVNIHKTLCASWMSPGTKITYDHTYWAHNSNQESGAAICVNDETYIYDSIFVSNFGQNKGGAFDGQTGADGLGTYGERLVFERNWARDKGGAVSVWNGHQIRFKWTRFTGNWANTAGALIVQQACVLTMEHCVLQGNKATVSGGAIQVNLASVTLLSTRFIDNIASNGDGNGGALFMASPVTVLIRDTNVSPVLRLCCSLALLTKCSYHWIYCQMHIYISLDANNVNVQTATVSTLYGRRSDRVSCRTSWWLCRTSLCAWSQL